VSSPGDEAPLAPPIVVPNPAEAPFGALVAQLDLAVENALDRWRGQSLPDRMFYAASALGDWSLFWHLVSTAQVTMAPRHWKGSLRLSVGLGVESLLVNQGIKRAFNRARPAFEGARPHGLRRPLTSSFPSGHASAAFCAAVLLADEHPVGAPLWYVVAAAVALSRPYVRVHHASDTLAGAAIGIALGHVVRSLWRL
jgi:membrane-associated phospholipid phosphatase